jgi:hypothetical protein
MQSSGLPKFERSEQFRRIDRPISTPDTSGDRNSMSPVVQSVAYRDPRTSSYFPTIITMLLACVSAIRLSAWAI